MAGPPPYARIAEEIRARIRAGELRPGDRVPSTRQITLRWGVAMATATKALATLRHEGLVRTTPGSGTVVAPAPDRRARPDAPAPPPAAGPTGPVEGPARDRLVRTAIRIADAEGLAALTMRRVAADLGVATMSLYRHVRGKEHLVALMADAVFTEEPLPEPDADWRTRLELSARLQWRLYHAHPWLARAMTIHRPVLAPGGMRHIDWALRALDGHGLDADTLLHTAITLFAYVRGAAADLETEERARQDTGISGDEWLDGQEEAMDAALAAGSLDAFADVRRRPGVDVSVESLFEYGLARFLDGVALLVPDGPPADRTPERGRRDGPAGGGRAGGRGDARPGG